jgi:hypothetical protein
MSSCGIRDNDRADPAGGKGAGEISILDLFLNAPQFIRLPVKLIL